ncbi:MAG TPA: hypothetical protein VFC58_12710 [Desulfosporosinus sp.]|nr:hypothetical protein [Desulfosporosinus sp.]
MQSTYKALFALRLSLPAWERGLKSVLGGALGTPIIHLRSPTYQLEKQAIRLLQLCLSLRQGNCFFTEASLEVQKDLNATVSTPCWSTDSSVEIYNFSINTVERQETHTKCGKPYKQFIKIEYAQRREEKFTP